MSSRIERYAIVAGLTAAVAGAFGPLRCGLYGCVGGFSAQTMLVALGVGAAVGLAGMALIDIAVNARYLLTNRALERQRPRNPPQNPD